MLLLFSPEELRSFRTHARQTQALICIAFVCHTDGYNLQNGAQRAQTQERREEADVRLLIGRTERKSLTSSKGSSVSATHRRTKCGKGKRERTKQRGDTEQTFSKAAWFGQSGRLL